MLYMMIHAMFRDDTCHDQKTEQRFACHGLICATNQKDAGYCTFQLIKVRSENNNRNWELLMVSVSWRVSWVVCDVDTKNEVVGLSHKELS